MNHHLLLGLAASLILFRATASAVPTEECTLPCNAQICDSFYGAIPPGVSWTVLGANPTPGTHPVSGCSTCEQCKRVVSVNINGHGTGWQVQVNYGGGFGQPVPSYNRGGKLYANCNGTDSVAFQLVMDGTVAVSAELCLDCNCN